MLNKYGWPMIQLHGGGKINSHYSWYKQLSLLGKKYGYLVNGTKIWLIVKSQALHDVAAWCSPTDGKRHLGAVIGSKDYEDHYCTEKVLAWKGEIETRNRKESTSCSLHWIYKGIQIEIHVLHAHNRILWRLYVEPIHEVLNEVFQNSLLRNSGNFSLYRLLREVWECLPWKTNHHSNMRPQTR